MPLTATIAQAEPTSGWYILGQLLTPLAVAIVAVMAEWIRRKRKVTPKPLEVQNVETNQQQRILTEMLIALGAMRCYFERFHNGDTFDDGGSVYRKSRVVEVVRDGVSYESIRNSGVLVSTVVEEMELVSEAGPSWFLTDHLRLSNFRAKSHRAGVVAGARYAVHKNGKTVGFIGVDFNHANKPANLDVGTDYAKWLEKTL